MRSAAAATCAANRILCLTPVSHYWNERASERMASVISLRLSLGMFLKLIFIRSTDRPTGPTRPSDAEGAFTLLSACT